MIRQHLQFALADYDSATVRGNRGDLVRFARDMMTNDQDFIDSISGSTGDVRNVRTRLSKVREAAERALA